MRFSLTSVGTKTAGQVIGSPITIGGMAIALVYLCNLFLLLDCIRERVVLAAIMLNQSLGMIAIALPSHLDLTSSPVMEFRVGLRLLAVLVSLSMVISSFRNSNPTEESQKDSNANSP